MNNFQKASTRRNLLKLGTLGTVVVGLPLIAQNIVRAQKSSTTDLEILNKALFYEHQAIWAYDVAAEKLSQSNMGKTILKVALANQADHKQHRDFLSRVILELGGIPVKSQKNSYLETIKAYTNRKEGNFDNDVSIAQLALALEVDAAIAYGVESSKFQTPDLIMAAASIGSNETAHATIIRSTFKILGVDLRVVAEPFINSNTRNSWILKTS